MTAVWVGLVGGLGALIRFEISRWIHRRRGRADRATTIVNLAGALAVGLVLGTANELGTTATVVLTSGFLGGFTTFSTWMVDVLGLAGRRGRGNREAALNLALTLVGGLAAYAAGSALAGLFSA